MTKKTFTSQENSSLPLSVISTNLSWRPLSHSNRCTPSGLLSQLQTCDLAHFSGVKVGYVFLANAVGVAHGGNKGRVQSSQLPSKWGQRGLREKHRLSLFRQFIVRRFGLTGDLTCKHGDIISLRGENWKFDSVHQERYLNDLRMDLAPLGSPAAELNLDEREAQNKVKK